MSPFFAASIFDSPLIIVAIVAISMIANWLSKRRQEKVTEHRQPGPRPSPGNPEQELDFEEVLRRLMRGEPAPKPPAPPPIPPQRRRVSQPEGIRIEEEGPPRIRQTVPPMRMPPLPVAQSATAAAMEGEQDQDVAAKIAALRERARQLSAGVRRGRGKRVTYAWHNPQSARKAFVASLVFGPPKALEP